ncbi:hypothetical protein HanRHA438_Chr03g0132431 [Helianthus annuus]|nr:hypothetical protein HanRHA438_Chr03g0132431 [Helianthus annuus]
MPQSLVVRVLVISDKSSLKPRDEGEDESSSGSRCGSVEVFGECCCEVSSSSSRLKVLVIDRANHDIVELVFLGDESDGDCDGAATV